MVNEYNLPEITPDIEARTQDLRKQQAPEDFIFRGNVGQRSLDEQTPTASQYVADLQKKFGEENVFTTSSAFNQDGSHQEGALAVYTREGSEPISAAKRVLGRLGLGKK